jgi:pyrroline-5-carboxylate reductase
MRPPERPAGEGPPAPPHEGAPASPIAFIGGGNMAGAIVGGLRAAGWAPESILVIDPGDAARDRLHSEFGVRTAAAADSTLAAAATVVWAVKPQLFRAAAAPCAAHIGTALQLSVMAGIRSDAIADATGCQRVVRAMPNTPALIGQGIAGLYARPQATAADRARAETVLAPTGQLLWVGAEPDLDAVTALSGSGPAYVFLFIESMVEAAGRMGLTPAQGRALALATFAGSTALAAQSSDPPDQLRERVTSQGGTTHAALQSMDKAQVKAHFVDAILAARQRARELGDEFGGA